MQLVHQFQSIANGLAAYYDWLSIRDLKNTNNTPLSLNSTRLYHTAFKRLKTNCFYILSNATGIKMGQIKRSFV